MTSDPDLTALVDLARRFDGPDVNAVVLLGSYARGDAGPFSDVDLVRFAGGEKRLDPDDGSYLIVGRLVVVSRATPGEVERWFSHPEAAVGVIRGLCDARALIDREGLFAAIQARAQAFGWDAEMQRKADRWASQQMVGWIEEVHKGLEGLRRGDMGRLLNARYGCSWGLTRVLCVQRGVLLSGDNDFYEATQAAVGADAIWARLQRRAFGLAGEGEEPPSLRDQVVAGLRLYVATADLLQGALLPSAAPLVQRTVDLIDKTLGPAT